MTGQSIKTIWLRDYYDPTKPQPLPDPAPREERTVENAVLQAMRTGVMGPTKIAKLTGIAHHRVIYAVQRLAEMGKLTYRGEGAKRRYTGVAA